MHSECYPVQQTPWEVKTTPCSNPRAGLLRGGTATSSIGRGCRSVGMNAWRDTETTTNIFDCVSAAGTCTCAAGASPFAAAKLPVPAQCPCAQPTKPPPSCCWCVSLLFECVLRAHLPARVWRGNDDNDGSDVHVPLSCHRAAHTERSGSCAIPLLRLLNFLEPPATARAGSTHF